MFRFTIRDVLWLMVVVGIASYAYRDRRAMELRVAKATAEQAADKERLENSRTQYRTATADLQSLFETMIGNNEREEVFEKMRKQTERRTPNEP